MACTGPDGLRLEQRRRDSADDLSGRKEGVIGSGVCGVWGVCGGCGEFIGSGVRGVIDCRRLSIHDLA